MNNKKIQKITDSAFNNFFNIYKTELMLKDWVFSAPVNATGKSWIELMTEEFLEAYDEPVQLEEFLQEAGVICAVEKARKSTAREGYYQALAGDMYNSYMLWWRASDVENGTWAQFEVEALGF